MPGKYTHTFVPQRPRRSRRRTHIRSRLLRWTLAGISLILCYQGVVRFCSQFDDTPRWIKVYFPNTVVSGQQYTVQVRYQGSTPTQLTAKARLIRASGRIHSELKPSDPKVNVRSQDNATFVFDIPQDPNVASIQVTVSNLALPAPQRNPAQRLHPFIKSRRIRIIAPDSKDMLKYAHQSAFDQILDQVLSQGHWKEFRGDPTWIGWLLTFLYLVVGLLCVNSTGITDKSRSKPLSTIYAWFWWLMAALLILIGINKQLDLQIFLADIGRAYTQMQGWYEQRKPVQIRFLALCATVTLAFIEWIGYKIRKAPKTTWTAGLGFIMLLLAILLKGAPLDPIKQTLNRTLLGLPVNNLMECVGILCMGLSCVLYNLTNRHEVNYVIQ